ncbi:hypothetical protein V5O48_008429 [Marasmius crinis-equi]|uniref:Proteophosphoglycan ppg4 n=1 Tax=Marasmius crinis-equi TaxID=585013 RepID=A0ABR3FEC4_9AGAR
MLIRLLPPPNQPTVLFKLTFENFPKSIRLPTAWSNQLAALAIDDLEVPSLLHAFDKSTGMQCMLEEVTFDLVEGKVKCYFIDGEVEQWDIREETEGECKCQQTEYKGSFGCGICRRRTTLTERLESVLDDVGESAKAMDRERKAAEEKARLREKGLEGKERVSGRDDDHESHPDSKSLSLNSPPGSIKGTQKKQRSMLMNLVASLLQANNTEQPERSRTTKKANSLPCTRSPSPSEGAPAETPSAESSQLPTGWSSWTSLARSVSNPITRRTSKRRHRPKAKSVSESPLSLAPSGNDDNPTIIVDEPISYSAPTSPTSTAPPSNLKKFKARPVSTYSLPDLPSNAASSEDPPAPIVIAPPPPPRMNARALRRRARSTLVDTFRLCVLPHLQGRVRGSPIFGPEASGWETTIRAATTYYNWSMGSMAKRVEKRLAEVVEEAVDYLTNAGINVDLDVDRSRGREGDHAIHGDNREEDSLSESGASTSVFMTATESSTLATTTATTVYESFDDTCYDSDGTTDTDGSSLHTPVPSSPILSGGAGYLHVKSAELQLVDESEAEGVALPESSLESPAANQALSDTRSSGDQFPSFPSVDLSSAPEPLRQVIGHLDATYTALIALHSHLAELVVSAREREKEAIEDAFARDEVLEVRCRRRAWLGKSWGLPRNTGEVTSSQSSSVSWKGSPHGIASLAVPFSPSGLGRHSWSADQWEYDPWYCYPGYCSDEDGHKHNLYHLYPGTRSDEYDDEEEDLFSSASSTSFHLGYQYQSSGAPYEEPELHSAEYSPRDLLRLSLDEGMAPLSDETFPEHLLPPSRFPSPALLEHGQDPPRRMSTGSILERTAPADGVAANSSEFYTNPFEDTRVHAPTPRRKSHGSLLTEAALRHAHGQSDILEEFFDWAHPQSEQDRREEDVSHDGSDDDYESEIRSVISPVGSEESSSTGNGKGRSSRRSSADRSQSTLFFPVSEDETEEDEDAFVFDVSALDVPSESSGSSLPAKESQPTQAVRPRVRTESFKLKTPPGLGFDFPKPPVTSTSNSPTSPRSPTSPTSLVAMSVSLLPVASDSSGFDLELVLGPSCQSPKSSSPGWIMSEGGIEGSQTVGVSA